MIYALNLLYSVWCSNKLSYVYEHSNIKRNFFSYFFLFSPIWIIWLLICGGQYGVGTDYYAYYDIFEEVRSEYYYTKGEWLFAGILEIGHFLGFLPQGMFFLFYFINFYFLFLTLNLLDKKYIFIFILLYIALSTVFNNQLNGLRQYSAIYIITYAIVSFGKNNSYLKCFFWIIIAGGIHFSSYLAFLFCFLLHLKNINKTTCYILIGVSAFYSLFGSYDWIVGLAGQYLPTYYLFYIDGDFNTSNSLIKILTKILFVPIYLLSVYIVKNNALSENDKYLYRVGIFAYSIRMFFLENFIFNRLGQLFVLLAIFPLYVYLKYLYTNKKNSMLLFIIALLILFYFSKTILFPSGEYLYQSIYFR